MSTGWDVIGLGELLWDCFPDERRPGGAPANLAFHAQQLGLSSAVATRVGNDELGHELVAFLKRQRLSTELVQFDPHHGTGTVTVQLNDDSPSYTFLENSAWDFLELSPEWKAALPAAKAVCFGTLAQRGSVSRRTIHEGLALTLPDCLKVYDVNLRPPFYEPEWITASLEQATLVKLNSDEVVVLSRILKAPADETAFAHWLLEKYALRLVCITRAERGALAVTATEEWGEAGLPIQLCNPVGAGDAFTAGLVWALLRQWSLQPSLQLANRLGALVASRAGAMPDLRQELRTLLAEFGANTP